PVAAELGVGTVELPNELGWGNDTITNMVLGIYTENGYGNQTYEESTTAVMTGGAWDTDGDALSNNYTFSHSEYFGIGDYGRTEGTITDGNGMTYTKRGNAYKSGSESTIDFMKDATWTLALDGAWVLEDGTSQHRNEKTTFSVYDGISKVVEESTSPQSSLKKTTTSKDYSDDYLKVTSVINSEVELVDGIYQWVTVNGDAEDPTRVLTEGASTTDVYTTINGTYSRCSDGEQVNGTITGEEANNFSAFSQEYIKESVYTQDAVNLATGIWSITGNGVVIQDDSADVRSKGKGVYLHRLTSAVDQAMPTGNITESSREYSTNTKHYFTSLNISDDSSEAYKDTDWEICDASPDSSVDSYAADTEGGYENYVLSVFTKYDSNVDGDNPPQNTEKMTQNNHHEDHFESTSSIVSGKWELDLTSGTSPSYSKGHEISDSYINVTKQENDQRYQTISRSKDIFKYNLTHSVIYNVTTVANEWDTTGEATSVTDESEKFKTYLKNKDYKHTLSRNSLSGGISLIVKGAVYVEGKVSSYELEEEKTHFSSKFDYNDDAKGNPWVLVSGDGYVCASEGTGKEYSGSYMSSGSSLIFGVLPDPTITKVTESGYTEDKTGEKTTSKVKNGKWTEVSTVGTSDHIEQSIFDYYSKQNCSNDTLQGIAETSIYVKDKQETHLTAKNEKYLDGWGKTYSHKKTNNIYSASKDGVERYGLLGEYVEWSKELSDETSTSTLKFNKETEDWDTKSATFVSHVKSEKGTGFNYESLFSETYTDEYGNVSTLMGTEGFSTWFSRSQNYDTEWTCTNDKWQSTTYDNYAITESGYNTFYSGIGDYYYEGFIGVHEASASTTNTFRVKTKITPQKTGANTWEKLFLNVMAIGLTSSSYEVQEIEAHDESYSYSGDRYAFGEEGTFGYFVEEGDSVEGYYIEKEYRLTDSINNDWEIRGNASSYAAGDFFQSYETTEVYLESTDISCYTYPYSYYLEFDVVGTETNHYTDTYSYNQTTNWEIGTYADSSVDWVLVTHNKKDPYADPSGGWSTHLSTLETSIVGQGESVFNAMHQYGAQSDGD
ncbi:MAG: hypothetical protein PVG39_31390, partial [Desulfobacteraceae bacterium]